MTELIKLSEIFQGRIFTIPEYQRGYAWRRDQIIDLISDIEDLKKLRATRPNYQHFTGTIVIMPEMDTQANQRKERINFNNRLIFSVVDGQQRLTALVIFINEIASKFLELDGGGNASSTSLRSLYVMDGITSIFRLNDESHEFFKQSIIGDATSRFEVDAHRNLNETKLQLKLYINELLRYSSDPRLDLDILTETITDGLGFLLYKVEGEHEVSVIFETLNSRGLELTQFEKTKNLLFFLAGRIEDDAERNALFATIRGTWAYVLRQLYIGGNPVDEDQFLRFHWAIYPHAAWFEEDRRDRTSNVHKAIKKTSATNEYNIGQADWLNNYLASIHAYIGIYCDIVNPRRQELFSNCGNQRNEIVETCLSVDRIGRDANLIPLMMASYRKYVNEPISLLGLFRLVETFSFRLLAGGRYSNTGRSAAFRIAFEIASDQHDCQQAVSCVKSQLINTYCDDKVFRTTMSQVANWYSWSGIRYLLFEYESCRARETHRALPIDWDEFMKKELDQTVEHVLPKGENTLSITYWGEKFTEEQWKENCNTLGNLCISESGANSTYSNRSFPVKCGREPYRTSIDASGSEVPEYLKKNYGNSPYQTEQDLTRYSVWNCDAISERQNRLVEFAIERWKS